MISVIICSRNNDHLTRLMQNIAETIGVEHEVVAIDNSFRQDGICQVYNEGAILAQYPLLCFIHEDVYFETAAWGKALIHHFSNPAVGLVGVAGGDTKSLVPSSWSGSVVSNQINIIQHRFLEDANPQYLRVTDEKDSVIARVATVDGVFLCTRKIIMDNLHFDEDNFPGFHGYDIDFSLHVAQQYEVRVVFDILLHHYSEGSFNEEWIKYAIRVSKKWKDSLPFSVLPLTHEQFRLQHWAAMQVFVKRMVALHFSSARTIRYVLIFSANRYFSPRRFFSLIKYLIIQYYQYWKQLMGSNTENNFRGLKISKIG